MIHPPGPKPTLFTLNDSTLARLDKFAKRHGEISREDAIVLLLFESEKASKRGVETVREEMEAVEV